MKTTYCEICGAPLTKSEEVYKTNGITKCLDCAFSQQCSVCGKKTKRDDLCHIFDKPVCVNCAFPQSGREGYEKFKEEKKQYNETKREEWKRLKRKVCLRYFVIVTAIFIIIDLIMALISYFLSFGQSVYIASTVIYLIVLTIVLNKVTPEYKPLTEKEFFVQKYKEIKAKKE